MDAENAPGAGRSDPDLLDALRRQARHLVAAGQDPWALLIMWEGQRGVERDDVIDVLKEVSRKPLPGIPPG